MDSITDVQDITNKQDIVVPQDIPAAAPEIYSYDEICNMLRDSDNPEVTGEYGDHLKTHMLDYINGQHQFIYNMLHTPDFKDNVISTLINRPNFWQEGYNAMVLMHQRYTVRPEQAAPLTASTEQTQED